MQRPLYNFNFFLYLEYPLASSDNHQAHCSSDKNLRGNIYCQNTANQTN